MTAVCVLQPYTSQGPFIQPQQLPREPNPHVDTRYPPVERMQQYVHKLMEAEKAVVEGLQHLPDYKRFILSHEGIDPQSQAGRALAEKLIPLHQVQRALTTLRVQIRLVSAQLELYCTLTDTYTRRYENQQYKLLKSMLDRRHLENRTKRERHREELNGLNRTLNFLQVPTTQPKPPAKKRSAAAAVPDAKRRC